MERLKQKIIAVLRWSERYTRTDMTYVGSGGFWLALDQVIGASVSFLVIIAFAHFASQEAYGTYRYLLATFWMLAAFTLTGLPTAVSQSVARGFDGTTRRAFWWSIMGGLPLTLIGGGMSIYYFLAGNTTLALGGFFMATLGPFMQPAHLFGAFLTGKKDFRRSVLFGAALVLVPSLGLIAAMLLTQNPLIYFAVYLGGTVATGILLYALIIRIYQPSGPANRDFRSLTAHFSVMNLLGTVAQQIDKIVVFHYLGAAQLAVYAFAIAMPEQLKGAFGSISVIAMPKFAERTMSEISKNFWARLWMFTAGLFAVSIMYVLAAPWLFSLLFPAYQEATPYSQLFVLSLAFTSSAVPLALFQAHAAKRELYASNILSPLFQIATLVLLTATYGLLGTIAARVISRVFGFVLNTGLVLSYKNRMLSSTL